MSATNRARLAVACALAAAAILAAASPASAQYVWAVGDGGVVEPSDDQLAAYIEQSGPFDRFLYLGDVYETGTKDEFDLYYHPSYGRFKTKSSPTPGNHEWDNRAVGYDPYWGSLAPQTNGGHWYSFDHANWHFVSINTMEPFTAGSPQIAWLKEDLARYRGTCTIAFMHHPRYTATDGVGVTERPGHEDLWNALKGHAVALLTGHDHNYERFQPVDGMAQFIVGTGGRAHHGVNEADPRLGYANDQVFGALRLQLTRGSAHYAFYPTGAADPVDSGTLSCAPHDALPSASFEWEPREPKAGQEVTFTSTSTDPDGPLAETAWDLDGDDQHDDAQGTAARTTFAAAGSHRVGLRVTDAHGNREFATRNLDVGAAPPPDPDPDPGPGPPAPVPSRVSVISPRHGAIHSTRLRSMRGKVAGVAGPVNITLVRRSRAGCTRFDGRRFVRASCRTRVGVAVDPTSRWRLSLPRALRLRPGVYRLTARITGADGVKRLAGVTFRIR